MLVRMIVEGVGWLSLSLSIAMAIWGILWELKQRLDDAIERRKTNLLARCLEKRR